MALSYIRSRKQLQEVLSKRLGSLATLESTLLTVETAAGDIEVSRPYHLLEPGLWIHIVTQIMKSYTSSTVTLRSILSHSALQRDNVDKTMDALAEANADARELDEAIRIGGDVALGVGDNVDESEIEEEWAALVKDLSSEEKETQQHATQTKLESETLAAPQGLPDKDTKSVEKVPVHAS